MSQPGKKPADPQLWLRRALRMPYLWLLLFFLAPFLIIVKISLAEPVIAQPPFSAMLVWGAHGLQGIRATFENYSFLFRDGYYGIIVLSSLKMAAIGTVLCLLLGYPMAYFIARHMHGWLRALFVGFLITLMLLSVLVRTYGEL